MPGFVKPCWIASPTERTSSKPELSRIAFDGLSRGRRKEPKHSRKRAVEMPAHGKRGKPTSAFPPFPPSLNIPQHRRDAHIPTAPTIRPYIKGQAQNPVLNLNRGWAKLNFRSGPSAVAK